MRRACRTGSKRGQHTRALIMDGALLLWALFVFNGGRVNSGYLTQTAVVAHFATEQECERVRAIIASRATPYNSGNPPQCIQARYVLNIKKD
jgi:hypothetical protein